MRIIHDLKRPFNLITLSIAVLSIILTIVFYNKSQKTRKPTYLVSEERPKIFDSTVSSPNIRVLDKDSKVIEDDIYVLTVAFWNAGELPIEPADIRRPVRARISPVKQLLDYSIVSQTDSDVAQIKITNVSQLSGNSKVAELELSWDHLDPGFGVRLQIIYTGEKDPNVEFSGSIVGVDELTEAKPIAERIWWPLGMIVFWFLFLLLIVVGASVFGIFESVLPPLWKERKYRKVILIPLGWLASVAFVLLLLQLWSKTPVPPV